jgi:ABC-type branched-subunit amino acid transport system substrate-binding protein
MMRSLSCLVGTGGVLLAIACSSPDLTGTNFSCSTDADCGSGQTCASLNGALACRPSDEVEPIRIGMIGPMEGPSEDLGKEMSRGIEAMLDRFNAAGGAFGRRVELEKRNDNYDPETAVEMMYDLLDIEQVVEDQDTPDVRGDDGVFAMVGNIGTPTMLATAPVATKNRVVFFAPFTGAQTYLRDSTKSPFVYNYRAGYFDETAAMVQYLGRRIPAVITDPETDYRRILVFAQNDTFGQSGYDGVVAAYNSSVAPLPGENAIARVGYNREQLDTVPPAVIQAGTFLDGVLARAPENSTVKEQVAVIMVDTYGPGDRFIRGVKDWINADAARASRLDVLFMNVSFVGSDSLAEALIGTNGTYQDVITKQPRSYAENVMVTQVVPDYESQAPCVVDYREDIRSLDSGDLTFTSLEGYVVTRLFTEALKLNGPRLSADDFVRTLDTKIVDLDIGIGTLLNFNATQHQATSTVWGTQIGSDGRFSVSFLWENGNITIE